MGELKKEKPKEIIELPEDLSFSQIYRYINELNWRGEDCKICYKVGNVILDRGITPDEAWNKLMGLPRFKEEYKRDLKAKEEFEEKIAHRRDYMSESDLANIEKVKNKRKELPDGKEIKDINVISGLKYLIENKDLPQEKFVEGLIDRGCVFLMNDLEDKNIEPYSADKLRNGEISAGAYVLINARDSEDTRKMYYTMDLFTIDDDNSLYHFIRVNGEPDYTKEYVDSLNANKKSL